MTMAKRKSETLRFYPWEVVYGVEVTSKTCQKIYRFLEDALFSEFNTAAVLSRAYADENCARFRVTIDPKDQEKLKKLILKFCQKQRLVLRQDDKQ
jgi:hypothetical protein